MSDLMRTTLAIQQQLLAGFDDWMAAHGYTNRSEAMRDLIRKALVEAEWSDPQAEVIAVLSVVFDHARHTLAQELTHIQHEDYHAVLCSQHVHLDHETCLEVVLMRGRAGQLRRLADSIIATRGVRAGELTLMSKKL